MASDLGLHYLPVTFLGVSRLKWVNDYVAWYMIKWKFKWSNKEQNVCSKAFLHISYFYLLAYCDLDLSIFP